MSESFQLTDAARSACIGKIFVKIVRAHRDTPLDTLRQPIHFTTMQLTQLMGAAHGAAHLLDNSRGLTAAARERMLDCEQSVN